MTPSTIENWVLDIFARVQRQLPVEDARVELKSTWIEPRAAARRIAGHANALRGQPALWVIGLDERSGTTAGAREEFSNWWQQVEAEFDGPAPGVFDLWVPLGNDGVTALLFDTSRAPFVIKNPVRNQPGAGPINLEVPWREGTRVRSARRSELLQLLVPTQSLPTIETLGGAAVAIRDQTKNEAGLLCTIALYVVPQRDGTLVLPFHKCSGSFTGGGLFSAPTPIEHLEMMPEYTMREMPTREIAKINKSATVTATNREVLLRGPGVVELALSGKVASEPERSDTLVVNVTIIPAGVEIGVPLEFRLEPKDIPQDLPEQVVGAWDLSGPGLPGLFVDIGLASGWQLKSRMK
jgi:hypothetical protein